MTIFSKSIIEELSRQKSVPCSAGKLFISPTAPAAALKLDIPLAEYLGQIKAVDPSLFGYMTPQTEGEFDVLIEGQVNILDQSAYLNGKKIASLKD